MLKRFALSTGGLLLVAGMMVGCSKGGKQSLDAMAQEMASAAGPLAEPVTILAINHGSDPGLAEQNIHLIQSHEDLAALGATTMGDPRVDFEMEDVIVLSLGEQPTAGYWTRITAIQIEGNELHVEGVANAPGPDEIVAQVVTYPYCVVKIPKTGATELRSHIRSVQGQVQ